MGTDEPSYAQALCEDIFRSRYPIALPTLTGGWGRFVITEDSP